MTSTPKARLLIEVFEDDLNPTDNLKPAVALTTQSGGSSGVYFEATVEYSTGEDFVQPASYMECKIANPSPEFIERISGAGAGRFIKLEAGWEGSNKAPVQTIFYGLMGDPLPYREGGEKWLNIQAVGIPNALYDTRPDLTQFEARGDDSVSLGEAIAAIGSAIGVNITVAGDLFDIKYPGRYSPQLSAAEEIGNLIMKANAATGKSFGIFPTTASPFNLEIVDLTAVVAIGLKQNLDAKSINSAGFITEEGETLTITSTSSPNYSIQRAKVVRSGIRIDKKFDPRIAVGLGINYEGSIEGEGVVVVTTVTHQIAGESGWSTSLEAINPDTITLPSTEDA